MKGLDINELKKAQLVSYNSSSSSYEYEVEFEEVDEAILFAKRTQGNVRRYEKKYTPPPQGAPIMGRVDWQGNYIESFPVYIVTFETSHQIKI